MDIDLLARMVKELILDRDRVVLPGLGTFTAEMVPATFSDRGYTINPPYRRLYFRSRTEDDSTLAELYAASNNVRTDVAERILTDFLTELKQVLQEKKTVVFPGLGRLRATKENNFFFIPDEDLDIYPEGFGLEPISLKTHKETREELSAAVSELKSIIGGQETDAGQAGQKESAAAEAAVGAEPDGAAVAEEEPDAENPMEAAAAEPGSTGVQDNVTAPNDADTRENDNSGTADVMEKTPDTGQEQDAVPDRTAETEAPDAASGAGTAPVQNRSRTKEGHPGMRHSTGVRIFLAVAAAAVILVILYIALSQLFPGIFDNILYSPEQLEILGGTPE